MLLQTELERVGRVVVRVIGRLRQQSRRRMLSRRQGTR
jgi:hypothetical protein